MSKILIVEDNEMISRVYSGKLAAAGFEVAVAEDGLEAMKKLPVFKPDLVVLDLLMPKFTGADVLKFVRENPALKNTRVVIFSNSFLSNLVEQIGSLRAERTLVKDDVNPSQLIEVINQVLKEAPIETTTAKPAAKPEPKPEPKPAPSKALKKPVAAAAIEPGASGTEPGVTERVGRDFIEQMPGVSKELRKICADLVDASTPAAAAEYSAALNRKISFLTQVCGMMGYPRTAKLCSACEALLFEVVKKPEAINDSSRQTIAAAVAFLVEHIPRLGTEKETAPGPMNVLIADDDAVSNRVLAQALGRSQISVFTFADPVEALSTLRQKPFDAVLVDINMPGISGFELCEQLRAFPAHKKTPVIFVTGQSDFKARARSTLSGGDDLIAKPISPVEVCVKVIMRVLQGR